MILKNLLRRKTRTLLTILGISIGVAAIIGLGTLANGVEAGYSSMMAGSKADLVLNQPNSIDVSYSAVDESVEPALSAAPEVAKFSPMLQGWSQTENEPFFFVFGYPVDSFVLSRFQMISGVGLDSREVQHVRGKPVLLGSAAAEILDKSVGDSLRLSGSVFRVVGIYETGAAFEDSGAVMLLKDAQDLLGRPRQASLYYIQLKDPKLEARFLTRAERQWPDLSVTRSENFADKQSMQDILRAYVWMIGGLAIIIGGVGMMNSQLMSVFERTREIGVLRAIGWGKIRVMWMILGESVIVCLLGGLLGLILGWGAIYTIAKNTVMLGLTDSTLSIDTIIQAFSVVLILGLVGGLYPAWRAARLEPIEALRYEGGGGGKVHHLPVGGMAVQSLWQRSARTTLTLGTIGITVGAIMALEGVVRSMFSSMSDSFASQAEIMIRQADVNDTSLSAMDERIGAKIAAFPEVASVDGMVFTAVMMPDTGGFFVLLGYPPNSVSLNHYKIVEGKTLSGNRQIIIGRMISESLHKDPGETIELSGTRFRIVGIYETGVGWEETGGVVTLRDAQAFTGRPRKATMYAVKLRDPDQASLVVEKINSQFDEAYATLSSEFVEEMPDSKNSSAMLDGISLLAILVGGVGVLNTMLMAVFERTREIGVLRALGWRRRAILGMIMQESLWLGLLGGLSGILVAFGLQSLFASDPTWGSLLAIHWEWDIFVRAILVAMLLGLAGGLYPALRATQLQPIEALRYE